MPNESTATEAGRELDALIASKVFGLTKLSEPIVVGVPGHRRELWWRFDGTLTEHPPEFSTDIAAAWLVVEKVAEKNRAVTVAEVGPYAKAPRNSRVTVRLFDEQAGAVITAPIIADAATAPHAICLAALEAVESSHV